METLSFTRFTPYQSTFSLPRLRVSLEVDLSYLNFKERGDPNLSSHPTGKPMFPYPPYVLLYNNYFPITHVGPGALEGAKKGPLYRPLETQWEPRRVGV